MKAHVITNGIITNTILVESLDVLPGLIDAEQGGSIGDSWDGATFTPLIDPPEPIRVPISISPRQIRQALTRAGLRAAVESAVAAGDQDIKDWWEFSSPFERNHPMVAGMAQALGVTSEQLDHLWIEGLAL